MSKHKKTQAKAAAAQPQKGQWPAWIAVGILGIGLSVWAIVTATREDHSTQTPVSPGTNSPPVAVTATTNVPQPPPLLAATQTPAPPSLVSTSATQTSESPPAVMEVNKAVMVTVDLDFGPSIPTIAEALSSIERRYEPDDKVGRTFAILDAYGEPTAEGKLHISMHVSTEKPGVGSLVFRKTGEVLWRSRINPSTNQAPAFAGKNLLILLDNGEGQGRTWTIDGSSNPVSILDAQVKELNVPVRDVWPDGAEREMTFIYSACGCPVKAMTVRIGDRTARTKDMPVMFPDDPAALEVISALMRWK